MAEESLIDSASVENLPLSIIVAYAYFLESKEYAVILMPVKPWLAQQNLSFVHEYLWSLSIAIERMSPAFDAEWMAKAKKLEGVK